MTWHTMMVSGASGALALCGVVALSGCDPVRGALTVQNDTTEVIQILHGDAVVQTVPSEGERQVVLRDAGECLNWELDAVGADGALIGSFGSPVCDEDVWTIESGAGSAPWPRLTKE